MPLPIGSDIKDPTPPRGVLLLSSAILNDMTNTKILWCEEGKHEWERESKRGRAPRNCPEHPAQKETSTGLTGLQKAQAARRNKKAQEEQAWAERVEAAINDPRMTYATPEWGDSRQTTVSKLRYIQNELQHNRQNREPHELADLEKMRERIMRDPFSRTGHLY